MGASFRAPGWATGTPADCVIVAPLREARLPVRGGRIGAFAPGLVAARLAAGDRLRARLHGAAETELRVVETLPAGRVVVTPETFLLVALRCRPSIARPCRRSACPLSWV